MNLSITHIFLIGYEYLLHMFRESEIEIVRVFFQHGAACRNQTCEGAAGLLLSVQMTRALGLIANWPTANSKMRGSGNDFGRCSSSCRRVLAYRFLDNDRVSEAEILAGHFDATCDRVSTTAGSILILDDTTELTYHREDAREIGHLGTSQVGSTTRPLYHKVCGILMHSSLAVTQEGLPLGLSAIKFWTREKFKGSTALKRHINPTRVPIEYKESMCWMDNLRQSTALLRDPARCVHIGDRGSDIYELFCEAHDAGTHFVFRTCVDRCAGDGEHTIADEMAEEHCKGLHKVEVQDRHGNVSEAVVELRYRRVLVRPPRAKQSHYAPIKLTVLHATERGKPKGRDPIDWKLITDLPVTSRASAIEKLRWYALRWKIGVSREGHVFKSVKVRPRPRDSGLVAWEAPLRESKTVEPSDNMLSKGVCAKHPVVSRMNAEVASLHAFPVAEMVDNKRKQQVPCRNESDATALTGGVSAATGCE